MEPNIVGSFCTSKKVKPPVETSVDELQPLGEYLLLNEPLAHKNKKFKRGTVCSDGRLDLCKQNIGPHGAEYVREMMKKNTKIKHLLMGDDSLGVNGAKAVSEIISNNDDLETIYLGCNHFMEEGSKYLTDVLKNDQHVKALWIKRNELGVGGAQNIADLLSVNTHLETLDLITNQLDHLAIELIVNGILSNPGPSKLTNLLLDSNPIGPAGALHLVRLIKGLPSLRILSLKNCNLGDEGCEIICHALSSTEINNLKVLDMCSNRFGPKSGVYIGEMLKVNNCLETLDLKHSFNCEIVGGKPNQFQDQGMRAIFDSLPLNQSLIRLDLQTNTFSTGTFGVLKEIIQYQNKTLSILLLTYPKEIDQQSIIEFKTILKKRQLRMGIHQKNEELVIFRKNYIDPIISVYRTAKDEKKIDNQMVLPQSNTNVFENNPIGFKLQFSLS
eukprot:gene4226-5291_t